MVATGSGSLRTSFIIPRAKSYIRPFTATLIPSESQKSGGNRIDLADIDALIDKNTKLVSVSLVSSQTGFCHDLKALCEIAHRKGALVMRTSFRLQALWPVDVQDSGVDFCCAAGYKWLMGEFGPAFLYVRPDRLHLCKRGAIGMVWDSYTRPQ